MRQKFVAGNWKMYTNTASAKALAAAVVEGLGGERPRAAWSPPAPYLAASRRGGLRYDGIVELGGQNCYPEKEGAFTGEVSPPMLADVGCKRGRPQRTPP